MTNATSDRPVTEEALLLAAGALEQRVSIRWQAVLKAGKKSAAWTVVI